MNISHLNLLDLFEKPPFIGKPSLKSILSSQLTNEFRFVTRSTIGGNNSTIEILIEWDSLYGISSS